MWKLKSTVLNNQQIKEEIAMEIRKYFKTNENKNTAQQSIQRTANAVFRGKFRIINKHIKKE